jgi:hypothetical protein
MKNPLLALMILDALVLLFSIAALLPTVMIFDDGNTGDKKRWVVFYLWVALPVVALVGLAGGWWLGGHGNPALALKLALAPIIWCAVGVAALLIVLK